MTRLLILSILAVLPMVKGQMITALNACTTKNNDLRVDCNHHKMASGNISYEWSLFNVKNETKVIASTIHPNKIDRSFKGRAHVMFTDVLLQLTLTGFGEAFEGLYMCRLRSDTHPQNDYNKTTPIMKAKLARCGAPGLVLYSPWMLSLLLSLTVLQALDALPFGSQN
ncbi:thy-1 membrane glycoprotein-like [Heterodontus francisci]|uniref:thy-1 membrane glycoprotein-like n=1 Tax=Heterodontus francisci TaxID=7792 RepID=UPI00355C0A03